MNQQGVLTTDEGVAFGQTFSTSVLHGFHDVEVLYLKDFCQLCICNQSSVGDSSTTVQAGQNVRVVNQDVTDFLADNHSVWLKATRLQLHGATSSGHITDWCRVGVIRPQVRRSSVCTPDTSSEEGCSELLFTVDQQAVNQSGCTSRTDVQNCIFVGKRLLVKVHAKAIHVSKVRVIRDRLTNTVDFGARSKFLHITSAVHVRTVVDVVLVRLLLYAHGWEHFVSDEVSLFLHIGQRQIAEGLVNMYIRRGQERHISYPLSML